ncbi:hypothetical protein HLB23_35105 [Nocardia uniformis]|uniref:Uncharacterized protein n=1 Tax=Nocardia uniformis TaxID=53432 RepID=A0A849CJV6_9NOCA|nr:hypothetical protein [Nocardia uniformis]NNH75021.1 hypothetical protein [Nocardia uniformis]
MSPQPTAIGYLRRDVSGIRQEWDETHIRSLARRFGYDLAKIVAFGPDTDAPITRLINVARTVDAVIVPSVEHFDGGAVPGPLVKVADYQPKAG